MIPYAEQNCDFTQKYQNDSVEKVHFWQLEPVFLRGLSRYISDHVSSGMHFKMIRFYGGLVLREGEDKEVVYETIVPLKTQIEELYLITQYCFIGPNLQFHVRRVVPYLQAFEMAALKSEKSFKSGRDGPLFDKAGSYGIIVNARAYHKKEVKLPGETNARIVADEESRTQALDTVSAMLDGLRSERG